VASASESWVPPSPCPLQRKEPLKVFFEASDDEEEDEDDDSESESELESSFDGGDNGIDAASSRDSREDAARCL